MKMLEIAALENGAHRNQTFHGVLPDGWAVIPEGMELPATFPFVEVEVKNVIHYKPVEVLQEVTRTREVPQYDEFDGAFLGNEVEEYTTQEWVTEQKPYTVLTVVSMTEGIMPERTPEVREPSQLDRIEAQITYTAMMTDTLLEV